jgi:hypothetical protein
MGLRFRVATTQYEREACYRVRFLAYKNIGYVDDEKCPARLIEDDFDKGSVLFMAQDDGAVVGTIRVTGDSDLGFPTEKVDAFKADVKNLRAYVDGQKGLLFDTSRVMVLPEFQGNSRALLGLSGIIYHFAQKHGITDYCFAATPDDGKMYEKIGITALSAPKTYSDGVIEVTGVPLHWNLANTTELYRRLFDRPDIVI